MAGKAKFVHWMVSPFEDIPSEPMFNVMQNDKGLPNGSTVSGHQLLSVYGIAIPLFPAVTTWQHETRKKHRCLNCWTVTRSMDDYNRHREIVHQIEMPAHRYLGGC